MSALPASPVIAADAKKPMFLRGDKEALWLVRTDSSQKLFDVAVKKADGKWQGIQQNLGGVPADAAATGGQLSVLFTDPLAHLVFHPDGSYANASLPEGSIWPAGSKPIAVCDADGLAPGSSGIFVIAPLSARDAATTTKTASAPATASSRPAPAATAPSGLMTLVVFLAAGDKWTRFAQLDNFHMDANTRVLAAVVGKTLYVYASPTEMVRGEIYR